ncbi:hypothetical protein Pmar_PMAR006414 [Perkinsus marinus ATCC 50983]|uniref:5'-3' exoribonuclease 1 SH3-like domain-containing protein n=1 Tax=Perkinsus marinus (strain ATCC 50983 / TXsc) TaxID=423536 RepID=C5K9M2_PERM5|nr:hypothetical protein Pmar_PMAR006414 [Perkinsus marinus ATCC 50983]EER18794.1 hypothetical protein Pmar_PMAR006414 [Perkinsus marinus ATCC 50983]|eukprot:XP_002786998.1 hypothetical protein Pmar_PMAR006414 [Perkinsus marinus ATCC 50983]
MLYKLLKYWEDYMEAFPSVFDGLCDLDHFDPKLALSAKRLLDTDTDDYEYELAKLKKWLSEQEFRRLPLVSSAYTALPRIGVRSLEVYLNRGVEENPTPPRITVTPEQLTPVENAKFVSKACQERPRVGNRAVYVGSDKPVPVGARCVVTSVYGRPGQDMKVELLFDRCTFGCDTAFGRCSPMRGLVVSPSDILVLPVHPTSPLVPHTPPYGNTYSSPPHGVTLDESLPMNGTGMSRKERSKRKVRKAPTVTYASRHPDTTILSHELRHMLGISPNNNNKQQS